jgi:hypothetical protein
MKTKAITLFAVLIITSFASYAQINPIRNLQFAFFYGYPEYIYCPAFNCFSILWEVPEASTDTLLGYRIYKNNVRWHFEDVTYIECMGTNPCQYYDIYDSLPCVIKVRAVYNSDSLESLANDSVYIEHIAIGIKELHKNEIKLVANPIRQSEQISIDLPLNFCMNYTVRIISLDGRLLQEITSNNISYNRIQIPSDKLNRGIYIISVESLKYKMTKKLIIE